MAQKRKNDGELPESSSCKKQKKMKGKANFIISAAAAIFFPLFSFIINNDFSLKVGKKTPPSIDQLEVRNSAIVQFPEEILVNILTRLPVKSLVRFKCVSKFWITLISDPYFTKKHLNRARNDQDSRKLLIYQWALSDEYKIIHMHQNIEGPYYTNEILALKDGCSWRSIDEHPRAIRCWFHASDSLPFIHAAFHWIQVSRNYFVVISFDISNEVYGEIPVSEEILSLKAGPDTVGVSVLEGMLCVYSNLFFTGNDTFVVWVFTILQ
uniref:F-box domain-containing protein n=1 Tax=Solanum lycopersicum TaxID=4081 RepID=K4D590_SOLLC